MPTKEDVASARRKAAIKAIERQGKLGTASAYVSFAVSKCLGVAGMVVGGLELMDPSILTVTLGNPEWVGGTGVALLTGKSILNLIAKVQKVI